MLLSGMPIVVAAVELLAALGVVVDVRILPSPFVFDSSRSNRNRVASCCSLFVLLLLLLLSLWSPSVTVFVAVVVVVLFPVLFVVCWSEREWGKSSNLRSTIRQTEREGEEVSRHLPGR